MKTGFLLSLSMMLVLVASASQPDAVDPRVRTFVYPTKVLWTTEDIKSGSGWSSRSKVEQIETLFERKHGQVCEKAFGKAVGFRLVNSGEAPGILLDFGKELHGGLHLGMSPGATPFSRLRLRFGESASEAMSSIGEKHATNDHALRDFEIPVPRFGSIEVGNTGFRFVRIDLVTGGQVGFEFIRAISLMRPMKAVGSFRSSDSRLNSVFDTAVRTVHLCCQEHLWDGIKRDRLVWMGDAYPETRTILSVFGADSVLPETLDFAAATTSSDKWMQSMPSYTLWWIRNLTEWYRYTGDKASVLKHSDYIRKTLDHVASAITPSNTWDAVGFLDWPTKHNPKAVEAGMQALCALAFEDASLLMEVLGDGAAAKVWRERSEAFRKVKCDPNGAKAAAAMLALGGVEDASEMYAKVLGQNGHEGVSTFYGYFMLEAMSAAGENQRALNTVRDYWGAMLDVGATSFWEDFNLSWTNNCFRIDEMPVKGKKDIHGDYGEFCYPGFRHSFCHGWAGGPAAWCINRVLGIRPLGVGCRKVEVKPFLGDLEWAEGAMALPDGKSVRVRAERRQDGTVGVKINAPEDVEIVR